MISESLSRRYSVAVFNLAQSKNVLDDVAEEFALIDGILRKNDKFRYFLFSPKIATAEKQQVLKSIFGDTITPTLLNFFFLVIDKKRQTLLLTMYKHFSTLYDNHRNRMEITIRPAVALDSDTHAEIKRVFEKATSKTVKIREEVDPSIVGGLKIRVNHTVYDSSILYSLSRMKDLLLN
jgi:F-type H+-transporting ATPase subunit delta